MISFWMPILCYLIVLSLVAKASHKAARFATFSLADRQVPAAILAASIAGTFVGPGFSMGWIGKGATSGYLFVFVGMAYVLQTILVGLLVAPRLRRVTDCHTLGDYFGAIYGSKTKVIVGFVSVGICAGFSAVMVKAGAILLGSTFNISPLFAAVVIAVITTIYTTLGGLRASITTDVFQLSFFGLTLCCVLAFVLWHNWPEAENFTKDAWSVTSRASQELGPFGLTSLLVAFFFGETLIPPYASRIFAAKTDQAGRTGFVLAGIYGLLWFLMMVLIGIQLVQTMPAGIKPDELIVQASLNIFPRWLGGFVFAALFAIIMSTLTSLLNSGAVSFSRDLLNINDESTHLVVARWATVCLSIVSVLGGTLIPGLVEGLVLCYTVWAPSILPGIILSLVLKNPQPMAGFSSVISGVLSALLWQTYLTKLTGIDPIIPSLCVSVICFSIGQAIQSNMRRR